MTLPVCIKKDFLESLAMTGNVRRTTAQLGIHINTAYKWRMDPEFDQAWQDALDINRQIIKERVVETAMALGVGEWVPEVDPITDEPVVDDEFEPVMRFDTKHIDARVLMKLMDKTMRDEVQRVDQRRQLIGADGQPVNPENFTIQLIDVDGNDITTEVKSKLPAKPVEALTIENVEPMAIEDAEKIKKIEEVTA